MPNRCDLVRTVDWRTACRLTEPGRTAGMGREWCAEGQFRASLCLRPSMSAVRIGALRRSPSNRLCWAAGPGLAGGLWGNRSRVQLVHIAGRLTKIRQVGCPD